MPGTTLSLSAQSWHLNPETSKDLTDILSPLESILQRTGKEERILQEKLTSLRGQNRQLAAKNIQLEQELALLRVSGKKPGGPPVETQAPVVEGHVGGSNARGASASFLDAQQDDGPKLLFDAAKRIHVHTDPVHSVTIDAMSWSQNSGPPTVVSASWDGWVKFYDIGTGEVVKKFNQLGQGNNDTMGGLYSVAFSKTTPNIFGCTSCDHSVYLWNASSGQLANKLGGDGVRGKGHKDEVNGIDFHSNQQVMCTASDDATCIIWDFELGTDLRKLDGHTAAVYGATFLTDQQYLCATACFDKQTRVWDIRDKHLVKSVELHTDDVIGIDYSEAQKVLATGSDDGLIVIWDTRTWQKICDINTRELIPENEVKRIAWSPCGYFLAAACSSKQVLVYEIGRGPVKLVAQLAGHSDCVFDVAWGMQDNKKVLVSACHDHTSQYWIEKRA